MKNHFVTIILQSTETNRRIFYDPLSLLTAASKSFFMLQKDPLYSGNNGFFTDNRFTKSINFLYHFSLDPSMFPNIHVQHLIPSLTFIKGPWPESLYNYTRELRITLPCQASHLIQGKECSPIPFCHSVKRNSSAVLPPLFL